MLRGKSVFSQLFGRSKPDQRTALPAETHEPEEPEEVVFAGLATPNRPTPKVETVDTAPRRQLSDNTINIIPAGPEANQAPLAALETDLRTLLDIIGVTLMRSLRPQVGAKGNGGAFGPFPKAMELAQAVEQRSRGLLLQTSLSAQQEEFVHRGSQSAQDLLAAARSARYSWQTCFFLLADPRGTGYFARIKPLAQGVMELHGRVATCLEQVDEAERVKCAKTVGAQYRLLMDIELELLESTASERSTVVTLARAAIWSLMNSAESMTKVAARFGLPHVVTRRHPNASRFDINDGLLLPLPPR